MSFITSAFILSTIAGLSTLIGFLFIFIKKDKNNIISNALGFASGVMITISIIDLIPNSLLLINKTHNIITTIFFILIGFLAGIVISNIIDKFVNKTSNNGHKLYKIGVISMLVIMMHNVPEDCVCYVSRKRNLILV